MNKWEQRYSQGALLQTSLVVIFPLLQSVTYRDNFEHLLPGDVSVTVQVVHGESPLELLLELAPGGDGQRAQELPEVDGTVAVSVERAEHVFGELAGVAVREEVAVDLLELVYGQVTAGTVLQEALIPLLDLGV